MQFELHLQAEIAVCKTLQNWEALVCFEKFYPNGVFVITRCPHFHQLIQISKSAILVALLAENWDPVLSLHRSGLYSRPRGSIHFITAFYAFILWGYLSPSRHPHSLLPILQTQLDCSETTCRWLLILTSSVQWLSWCVWERKSHTPLNQWAGASDGFLSSHECAVLERKKLSSCKCSGAFAGRNESLGIWDIWGKSYLSYSGVTGFFTMVLARQTLPSGLKHSTLEASSKRL